MNYVIALLTLLLVGMVSSVAMVPIFLLVVGFGRFFLGEKPRFRIQFRFLDESIVNLIFFNVDSNQYLYFEQLPAA